MATSGSTSTERTRLLSVRLHDTADRGDLVKPNDEAPGKTSSFLGASMILANIVLGSGLLNFPSAYKDAGGIFNTIMIQACTLLFIEGGIILMAYCSDLTGRNTYQDVTHALTGKIGLHFSNVLIVIHDFGSCVTYLIIIADQVDRIINHLYGETYCHEWFLNRSFTLTVLSAIFILPFCFPPTIASFRIGSALGVLTTVYLFVLIIYKYYMLEDEPFRDDLILNENMGTWTDMFKVIPIIIFSFDSHIESVPTYASLKKRNLLELVRTLTLSTIISVTVYNLVGAYGYMTFGQYVKTDILTSYSPLDIPIILGMTMVAIKSMLTYPVVFFCARLVMMDVFGSFCGRHCGWSERSQRVTTTIVLFVISLILALVVPNIGVVISLLGGTAALFIFVFPGLCFMRANLHPETTLDHLKRLLGSFYIVVGTFFAASITTQSISSYMSGELTASDITCT